VRAAANPCMRWGARGMKLVTWNVDGGYADGGALWCVNEVCERVMKFGRLLSFSIEAELTLCEGYVW